MHLLHIVLTDLHPVLQSLRRSTVITLPVSLLTAEYEFSTRTLHSQPQILHRLLCGLAKIGAA